MISYATIYTPGHLISSRLFLWLQYAFVSGPCPETSTHVGSAPPISQPLIFVDISSMSCASCSCWQSSGNHPSAPLNAHHFWLGCWGWAVTGNVALLITAEAVALFRVIVLLWRASSSSSQKSSLHTWERDFFRCVA